MKLKREREIHKLLPQTHCPGVDYSLFIMETVEISLGVMETTPAALRRSFPPPICSTSSLFRCFGGALLWKTSGDYFYSHFYVKRKLREERSTATEPRGPKQGVPCGQGIWPHGPRCFGPRASTSSPPSLIRLLPSKIDPRKFSGHLDVVWVPETQKYRK